jgi:hypothetical protein
VFPAGNKLSPDSQKKPFFWRQKLNDFRSFSMSSYFLSDVSGVQEHLSDGFTWDIQPNPIYSIFATISGTSVGIRSALHPHCPLLAQFQLTPDQQLHHLSLIQLSWLSATSFVCLTENGHLILFHFQSAEFNCF